MQKEIGSTYWLAPNELDGLPGKSIKNPGIHEKASYVSTCRSAIGIVLDLLGTSKKVALVPAFTCESVLVSFLCRGYKVCPYPIRKDLTIDWQKFWKVVESVGPSVILVHSYFGFDTISELRPHVKWLREQGIIVVEDQTQTMFSNNGLEHANFHVGSIRKWMPLPDGAFVTAPFFCDEEDVELSEAKVKALIDKGNWMLNGIGSKHEFQNDFRRAEDILDGRTKPYMMSSVSREIYAKTNINEMKLSRRNNCQALLSCISLDKTLSNNLLLPIAEIRKEDCPFHLPVLVREGRKELQQYLAAHNVYATVIWGCPDVFKEHINDDARYVYDHILCFHVDQRYDESDMNRIITVLKDYYQSKLYE